MQKDRIPIAGKKRRGRPPKALEPKTQAEIEREEEQWMHKLKDKILLSKAV